MLISTTQYKRTISAWMITLIIHALLICILLWWRYQLPSPELKEEELGMEVNLGIDENRLPILLKEISKMNSIIL